MKIFQISNKNERLWNGIQNAPCPQGGKVSTGLPSLNTLCFHNSHLCRLYEISRLLDLKPTFLLNQKHKRGKRQKKVLIANDKGPHRSQYMQFLLLKCLKIRNLNNLLHYWHQLSIQTWFLDGTWKHTLTKHTVLVSPGCLCSGDIYIHLKQCNGTISKCRALDNF